MMEQREFDSRKFVQVTHGYFPPPKSTMKHAIKECVNSAIFMASQIELAEHCLSTFRLEIIRPAYFRSSLNELCRIEDIMVAEGLHKFHESDDPTLHIVKLLRNYQVHIGATELSSGYTTVKYSGEQMIYHSFIAENVSATELRKLYSAKPYTDEQLKELVNLFDLEQHKLGVVQLLYHLIKHVEEYARHSLMTQKRAINKPRR